MKTIVYVVVLVVFVMSCATTTQKRKMDVASVNKASDTIRIANDSLEYEILIIEPGFNSWIITQRPRGYYSVQFLESRNRLYVTQYNQRVMQPQRFDPNLYMQQINYEPNINYGYEVNYLLYNYFLYFEQRYRQRFIATRGRSF